MVPAVQILPLNAEMVRVLSREKQSNTRAPYYQPQCSITLASGIVNQGSCLQPRFYTRVAPTSSSRTSSCSGAYVDNVCANSLGHPGLGAYIEQVCGPTVSPATICIERIGATRNCSRRNPEMAIYCY